MSLRAPPHPPNEGLPAQSSRGDWASVPSSTGVHHPAPSISVLHTHHRIRVASCGAQAGTRVACLASELTLLLQCRHWCCNAGPTTTHALSKPAPKQKWMMQNLKRYIHTYTYTYITHTYFLCIHTYHTHIYMAHTYNIHIQHTRITCITYACTTCDTCTYITCIQLFPGCPLGSL